MFPFACCSGPMALGLMAIWWPRCGGRCGLKSSQSQEWRYQQWHYLLPISSSQTTCPGSKNHTFFFFFEQCLCEFSAECLFDKLANFRCLIMYGPLACCIQIQEMEGWYIWQTYHWDVWSHQKDHSQKTRKDYPIFSRLQRWAQYKPPQSRTQVANFLTYWLQTRNLDTTETCRTQNFEGAHALQSMICMQHPSLNTKLFLSGILQELLLYYLGATCSSQAALLLMGGHLLPQRSLLNLMLLLLTIREWQNVAGNYCPSVILSCRTVYISHTTSSSSASSRFIKCFYLREFDVHCVLY